MVAGWVLSYIYNRVHAPESRLQVVMLMKIQSVRIGVIGRHVYVITRIIRLDTLTVGACFEIDEMIFNIHD